MQQKKPWTMGLDFTNHGAIPGLPKGPGQDQSFFSPIEPPDPSEIPVLD